MSDKVIFPSGASWVAILAAPPTELDYISVRVYIHMLCVPPEVETGVLAFA